MALYNADYFKQVARSQSPRTRTFSLNEQKGQHETFDIFLCHSYDDKEVVEGIYFELTNRGYSVYVDWIIDRDLNRSNVTKESAAKIRQRLRSSRSLIAAISSNSTLSKWMPWEIGIVDGLHQKCSLLPVSPYGGEYSFEGTEYLKNYPYIKQANFGLGIDTFVISGPTEYVSLTAWVRNNTKPSFNAKNIQFL